MTTLVLLNSLSSLREPADSLTSQQKIRSDTLKSFNERQNKTQAAVQQWHSGTHTQICVLQQDLRLSSRTSCVRQQKKNVSSWCFMHKFNINFNIKIVKYFFAFASWLFLNFWAVLQWMMTTVHLNKCSHTDVTLHITAVQKKVILSSRHIRFYGISCVYIKYIKSHNSMFDVYIFLY